MNTITVRDIRQRWPEAEKRLAEEGELIVTRDSRPVAKLVAYSEPKRKRAAKPFDAAAHMRWLMEISKDDPPDMPTTEEVMRVIRGRGLRLTPRKK